ncbi:transcriptional regulator, TetR family, partial [mine drainage metagenome]
MIAGNESDRAARPQPRRPGRPRERDLDTALLGATVALLDEVGYLGLTLEGVARRAGASRPALYRRWSHKAALVVDALASVAGTDPAPDTGTLRGDLLAVQVGQAALFNTALARRVVLALLADLAGRPEFAARFLAVYVEPRRASVRRALARAEARGEISSRIDEEVVCDLLAGPPLAGGVGAGPATGGVPTPWPPSTTVLDRDSRSTSP